MCTKEQIKDLVEINVDGIPKLIYKNKVAIVLGNEVQWATKPVPYWMMFSPKLIKFLAGDGLFSLKEWYVEGYGDYETDGSMETTTNFLSIVWIPLCSTFRIEYNNNDDNNCEVVVFKESKTFEWLVLSKSGKLVGPENIEP